jgi:hypothetical protein
VHYTDASARVHEQRAAAGSFEDKSAYGQTCIALYFLGKLKDDAEYRQKFLSLSDDVIVDNLVLCLNTGFEKTEKIGKGNSDSANNTLAKILMDIPRSRRYEIIVKLNRKCGEPSGLSSEGEERLETVRFMVENIAEAQKEPHAVVKRHRHVDPSSVSPLSFSPVSTVAQTAKPLSIMSTKTPTSPDLVVSREKLLFPVQKAFADAHAAINPPTPAKDVVSVSVSVALQVQIPEKRVQQVSHSSPAKTASSDKKKRHHFWSANNPPPEIKYQPASATVTTQFSDGKFGVRTVTF